MSSPSLYVEVIIARSTAMATKPHGGQKAGVDPTVSARQVLVGNTSAATAADDVAADVATSAAASSSARSDLVRSLSERDFIACGPTTAREQADSFVARAN